MLLIDISFDDQAITYTMHEEDLESKDTSAFSAPGRSFQHVDSNGYLDSSLSHDYSPFSNIRDFSSIWWIFMQEHNPTRLYIMKLITDIVIFYDQVLHLWIASLGLLWAYVISN